MTVASLQRALSLTVFSLPCPDVPVTGGYCGDLLSWVMSRAAPGSAWLTIMSNRNVAAVAALTEVSCVLLAEGVSPDPDLLEACQTRGINLLGSEASAFQLSAEISKFFQHRRGDA